MRFVLEASVALAWFLPDEQSEALDYARRVFVHVDRELAFAVVPLVWHEEVAGTLVKRLRAGRYYGAMPLETHVNSYTVGILLERAKRYGLQAIDAIYCDLAVALGLTLATNDQRLRNAAAAHGVKLFEPDT